MVIVVACLVFVLMAFMGWLVTCTAPFYESGCDRSANVWMNVGFGVTGITLVVGAVLTIALTIRLLGRWASPRSGARSLSRHAAVPMVLAVAAFILAVGGGAIAAALREPSAQEVLLHQRKEQAQ